MEQRAMHSGMAPTQSRTSNADVNISNITHAHSINAKPPTLNDPSNTLFRGHAFRTKFNGNTCAASWSQHVPGLSDFTKDAFSTSPAFEQVEEFLRRSETRTVVSGLRDVENVDLRSLLPARSEADRLVNIYLDSFDLLYPVMYLPEFQKEYTTLWQGDISSRPRDLRPLILILLVIAIANCVVSTPLGDHVTDDLQIPRDKATFILDSCENWLTARIQQYASLIDFQIAFLMLLGRQLNARRSKRTWVSAGGVLRVLCCAGLHRDPVEMGKQVSTLHMIMRQRLWASITDFELQAALDHGMPPASWPQQSDIRPPPNVNDDDLEDCQPAEHFTKSSFLVVAEKSIMIRHQLCCTLNDMRLMLPNSEANYYTTSLRQHLEDIPQTWIGPGARSANALLRLNLHQYILAIHEQQLRQPTISSVQKQASRMVLLESAMQMIEIHKELYSDGLHIVEVFYGDHVRAALAIALVYTTADPLTDSFLLTSAKGNALEALETISNIYCEKIVKFGGSKLHMWLISATALLKGNADLGRRAYYIETAVEHFTRPYYRLMASTRDGSRNTQRDIKPVQSSDELSNTNTGLQLSHNLPMLSFGEFAEWTFDEFSLDPTVYLG